MLGDTPSPSKEDSRILSEINIMEYCKELFSLKNEKFKIYADLKVFDFSDFELKEVKTLI